MIRKVEVIMSILCHEIKKRVNLLKRILCIDKIFAMGFIFFFGVILVGMSPIFADEVTSTNVQPMPLQPQPLPDNGYPLAMGQAEFFCQNSAQPFTASSQYKGYFNCTSPKITDEDGKALTCAPGMQPTATVAFSQNDVCNIPSQGSACGGVMTIMLQPSNGIVGYVNSSQNSYALCFQNAFALMMGSFGSCHQTFPNTAIIVNYVISCQRCPPSGCSQMQKCTPPYTGPRQYSFQQMPPYTYNNGVAGIYTGVWCGDGPFS